MESEPKVFTVSEINRSIKTLLLERKEFKNIWIRGEISNYSSSGSGHIYFSLKDSTSIIRCTFFAGVNQNYRGLKLKNGLEIQVFGSLTVYEPQGSYSINVLKVQELGKGDLLQEKEILRRKLFDEGLFDPARKKTLPTVPQTIGVATALNGAAIEDIIKTIRTRNDRVNILIAPCLVQGEQAPASIIAAIKELNNPKWKVDVIIAGRGGGSAEDLMAFDNEAVVRAFFHSRVPIVSAVGHEVDSALTDLSADMSVPTPTAAAELVTPELDAELDFLDELENRLTQALGFRLQSARERFHLISTKHVFEDGNLILYDRFQRLDEVLKNLNLIGQHFIALKKNQMSRFEKLPLLIKGNMKFYNNKYEILSEKIENFSPLGTLKRGYSVVRNEKKDVIHSIAQVNVGDNLEIILDEGRLKIEVKGKTK